MNGGRFKDYYKILGISKGASQKEIEKAFRELAKKYHPVANPGNKEADGKFKEITEAYNVLSKPEKRKQYDQGVPFFSPGGAGDGFGGFTGGDPFADFGQSFSDLFDIFTGFSGQRRTRAQKGQDLLATIQLSFKDALKGVSTKLNVTKEVVCPDCTGSGAQAGTSPVMCPECQGRGIVAQNQGFFSLSRTCPRCGGKGTIVESPCSKCKGAGRTREVKTITAKIPAGVENDSRIRIRGEGEAGVGGGPPGDLYIITRISPHAYFKRAGSDVLLDLPLKFAEAALGATVKIPTPNEKRVSLKIPAGTQDGQTFRVKGKGFPNLSGFGKGDMLVTARVAVPKKLTKEEKQLLSRYASISKDDPRKQFGE